MNKCKCNLSFIIKSLNNSELAGLQAGVLYNISLYAEEASGVSNPECVQVYAREKSKFMIT